MKGEILRSLREQMGITQKELAKHIHVSQTAISQFERDKATASREAEEAIAAFFSVSIEYLNGVSEHQGLGACLHEKYGADKSLLVVLKEMIQLSNSHKTMIAEIVHSFLIAEQKK